MRRKPRGLDQKGKQKMTDDFRKQREFKTTLMVDIGPGRLFSPLSADLPEREDVC